MAMWFLIRAAAEIAVTPRGPAQNACLVLDRALLLADFKTGQIARVPGEHSFALVACHVIAKSRADSFASQPNFSNYGGQVKIPACFLPKVLQICHDFKMIAAQSR